MAHSRRTPDSPRRLPALHARGPRRTTPSARDVSRLVDAHNSRGIALFGHGRLREAIAEWQAASRLDPFDFRFHVNIGAALHTLRNDAEAATVLREAIRLNPASAEAHDNLGVSLKELDDFDGSIAAHREAIRLRPGAISMRRNLAATLDAAGRATEAAAVYGKILQVHPDDIEAAIGRGITRLTLGDPGGWSDFDRRHDRPESLVRQIPDIPRWRGEEIPGTLLLNALLDGYGDAIQGIRFAAEVRRRVGSTVVLCDPPLAALMGRCPGVDRVVTDRAELPAIDAQASILSLAAIIGVHDAVQTSRYLSADPTSIERWRPALAAIQGLKVGVVWQGSPSHVNDRRRSFRLADVAPLAEIPGVSLVSLQRGVGADQIAGSGFPIADLGPTFAAADMIEAAGVIENLDLVIAADTGLAHLAGALGTPSWMALAAPSPDWRWMRDRDDSPWYPTMRLFRQDHPGDWAGVFHRMAHSLGGIGLRRSGSSSPRAPTWPARQ